MRTHARSRAPQMLLAAALLSLPAAVTITVGVYGDTHPAAARIGSLAGRYLPGDAPAASCPGGTAEAKDCAAERNAR